MKTMMKTIQRKLAVLLGVATLVLVPVLSANADKGKAEMADNTLYAVTFHADWCGTCRKLEPELTSARANGDLDNQNVLFVTLDLTNDTTKHQAALMASALGISDFYESNRGKTGFVLLVNGKTGETVGRIKGDTKAAKIEKKVMKEASKI